MAEYQSIVYMDHILFIHSSVNGHLDLFHLLAMANNAAINMGYTFLFVSLLLLPLGLCPDMECLDHMLILFFIF